MRPLLLAFALVAGCAPEPETVAVRAVYEKTVFDGAAATFDHESIPDVMDAMRMDFPITTPEVVAGLRPGDKVTLSLQTAPSLEVVSVVPLADSTRLRLARH